MIDVSKLSPNERKIIEARREYQRKWKAEHKDKAKEHSNRFYERLAAKKNGGTAT